MRDLKCRFESRTRRVLRNIGSEVRLSDPGHQGQPGCHFEFVVDEYLRQSSRCDFAVSKVRIALIIEDAAKKLAVMLPKSVDTNLNVIPCHICAERCLKTSIV